MGIKYDSLWGCLLVLILFSACSANSSILKLGTAQSMSITGKGPGQDAAINPYGDQKSMSVIKNLGKNAFSVRIQDKGGGLIDVMELQPKEQKFFNLEVGYELYLDSDLPGKARVTFKKE
jgi:hypothetical protein